MASWDKFEINSSGKVIIEKTNGAKLEKALDILQLPSGKYFVDKKYLRELKEYSPETLKNTPIYSCVGTNFGNENKGIAVEIRDIEISKLHRLEGFIKEISEAKLD